MAVGISPFLANSWLGALRNTPFTIGITVVQLHTGDPGAAGTSNVSTQATGREAATFSAPVDGLLSTTGNPPAWTAAGPETISYISVWDAYTSGNWLWSARLEKAQTIADGDIFRMGSGMTLRIEGLST